MQLVLAVGIAIAAVVIVGALGAVGRAVGSIARGLGPALAHRPDPWPPGVQEEDRDRPWGR